MEVHHLIASEAHSSSGAPSDGFLLNTLKTLFLAIQSTFRYLEMYSKGRYKICICSVILSELLSLFEIT